MNKQNFVKNISLVPRKKSPTPVKHPSSTQLSFKNIKTMNSKSFVKQTQRDHDTSLSPISTKRNKPNASMVCRVENSVLHTEAEDNSTNQNNSSLIEAFKLERESLMNTLKMYKQQVEVLKVDNGKLKKEAAKVKQAFKEKQEFLLQQKKNHEQLSLKVKDYQNMLPKLIELQQLQQKIIQQNNSLKTKIKVQEGLLNNVANIAKCTDSRTNAIDKIFALTQGYHVSKKKQSK